MMIKNCKKYFALLIFGVLTLPLFAQTDHWTLVWENNSEPDMYLYRVFRGPDSLHLTQIDSVYFPDSTYQDYAIEKGVLYVYALKAVDFSLNASEFSEKVSAALPKIVNLPLSITAPPDSVMVFDLNAHVQDPDGGAQNIQWQVDGYNTLSVNLNNQTNRLTITTPSNWQGSEEVRLTATDNMGFYDRFTILISARIVNQPPVFATVPQQSTNEDTPLDVHLLPYVQDPDTPPDSLTFTAKPAAHVQVSIKDSVLHVVPEKDWYGSTQIEVVVSDNGGKKDSTQIKVVVNPVNDPPILSTLPNLRLKQDTLVTLQLNPYVYDVDHSKSQLSWSFANHPHLTIEYDNQSQSIKIITPVEWSGFEYILATVSDPEGGKDSDTLIVQVLKRQTLAPQILSIPEIRFNEDESTQLDLNRYVEDNDTPLPNLFWEVKGAENILFTIDYKKKVVTFTAKKDWYGSEILWFKVTDPDQQSDSAQVKVSVLPVNDPPYFKGFPVVDLSQKNPRQFNFRNFIADVDNAVESLFLRALEPGVLQIDINGDDISFMAPSNWYGAQDVPLIVQDPTGASDTTIVMVYRQNLQHAPKIVGLDSLHMDEDQKKVVDLSSKVSDPDNSSAEINWEVFPGTNIITQYDTNEKKVVLQPQSNWYGKENVVLKATDPDGYFDYDTLLVVVRPVNDPPVFKPIPGYTMLAGTYFTIDLKQYLIDADGYDDIVKIELLNNPQSFIGYYLADNGFRATFFAPQGFHGKETFMVRATDRAGETAVSIFYVQVLASSIEAAIDARPFGNGTVVHMEWQTRMPTRDHVQYSLDYSFNLSTPQEAEFSTSHKAMIENLQPNQTYHFRIVSVDENGNVIYNPDTVFTTGTLIEGVNVFPIPYRLGDPNSGDGIYFSNLKKDTRIFIYNLLGELVLEKKVAEPIFKWDLKNSGGQSVRSGLYLYVVETGGKKYHGKIIIIR